MSCLPAGPEWRLGTSARQPSLPGEKRLLSSPRVQGLWPAAFGGCSILRPGGQLQLEPEAGGRGLQTRSQRGAGPEWGPDLVGSAAGQRPSWSGQVNVW